MLKRAKKRKLIDWSPEEMIQDLDTSGSSFRKVIKEPDEVVFDEDELPIYVEYLEENLDLKNLGILLMFFTGVRVGELVTLKFSDIEDNTIKIRRTETRERVKKGQYRYRVKESPKSEAGIRTVILPDAYSWIIPSLKACSPSQEYVFTADDGTRNSGILSCTKEKNRTDYCYRQDKQHIIGNIQNRCNRHRSKCHMRKSISNKGKTLQYKSYTQKRRT